MPTPLVFDDTTPVEQAADEQLELVGDLDMNDNKITATGVLIVEPGGIKALQADSAGNARGDYAIDLQMARTNAAEVASGDYTVIGGGKNNKAIGYRSGIFCGYQNYITSLYSIISGGTYNLVEANTGAICGGNANEISDTWGFIGGGNENKITEGIHSVVCGGQLNEVNDSDGFIGGGYTNTITNGMRSTIGGGSENTISNAYSFIGGGSENTITTNYSAIAGGYQNTISDAYSFIGGGKDNSTNRDYDVIGGGNANIISTSVSGSYNVIGGGKTNILNGDYSYYNVIDGGLDNTITSGSCSAIVGGQDNEIIGPYHFIGGGRLNTITQTDANKRCYIVGTDATIDGGSGGIFGSGLIEADYCHIVGSGTIEEDFGNILGISNKVTAEGGTAMGYMSRANIPFGLTFASRGEESGGTGTWQTTLVTLRNQSSGNGYFFPLTIKSGTATYPQIPENSAWLFNIHFLAFSTEDTKNAAFQMQGVVRRTTGYPTIIGTPLKTVILEEGSTDWDVDMVISSYDLIPKAKSPDDIVAEWCARLELTQIQFDLF